MEEAGEICRAVLKNDESEIIDGIGDCVVVLTNLAELLDTSIVARSDIGYEKYGRTLDEERKGDFKNLAGYLNDIQEELMDAVLYIQAAREELEDRGEKV